MSMFDAEGQATDILSDEALFGAEGEMDKPQEAETEPVTEEDLPTEESPADEQTSDVQSEAETAEQAPEGQAQTAGEENKNKRNEMDELRRWNTRVAMRNAELRQQIAQLRAQQTAQAQPKPVETTQADGGKAFVQQLLEKGDAALLPVIEQIAERKAQAMMQPILTERENAQINRSVEKAISEFSADWAQLNDPGMKAQAVRKMFELSMVSGNADAWKTAPDYMMFQACRSLWGMPRVVDKTAIEAARKAERESIAKAQKENKAGLAANVAANRSEDAPKSDEDRILEEIFGVHAGGTMFK